MSDKVAIPGKTGLSGQYRPAPTNWPMSLREFIEAHPEHEKWIEGGADRRGPLDGHLVELYSK